MGSIVVSDVGGHHFHNTMFGGAGAHQTTQESPAVHHVPVRPSSQLEGRHALRGVQPADTHMADAAPASVAQHRSSAQHGDDSSSHQRSQMPSAKSRPTTSQHSTPAPTSYHTPNVTSHSHHLSSSSTPSAHPSPLPSSRITLGPAAPSPRRIKVKSLSHIQSLAADESTRSLSRRQRRDPADVGPQYEISEMPVTDIIEMVAGLLTKITTTNDKQHEHLHRHIPPPEGSSGLSEQTTSVLAFHGKNVPSITILNYLSRIHKYCPTTYEVFLSLLVYFDRMTERVNAGPMQSLRQANRRSLERHATANEPSSGRTSPAEATAPQESSASIQTATPPPSGSLGHSQGAGPQENQPQPPSPPQHMDPPLEPDPYSLSQFFVVDSYNIHRLVIAGVTCASKFFSDVFYTNSRYAKVGGLPLVELNHLELQFLLLNDFRLAVPLEEMEAYGTMLVEFYAREIAKQNERPAGDRGHAHSSVAA
ncbi:cyclin-domain-containing protein [Westerdykella ornata]|uniref:Cyclin-domain-containing protein n=1 Tax=Westerdykella ornata TaxID=318751 RepID=A0A6A6JYU0_WESOR|nr:cyclin-domain-containing protein [Westerdykella ornata]KAF2281018.1 cyclin-domain-containing protein [Westerdykella ornata]